MDAYVTVADGIHGEQIVAVAQLEADHILGGSKFPQLLLLGRAEAGLLDRVLEQERVLTHALHGLQQVGVQVHLVTQLLLLVLHGQERGSGATRLGATRFLGRGDDLEEDVAVAVEQGVCLGLVLAVEHVEAKLFLLQKRTQGT